MTRIVVKKAEADILENSIKTMNLLEFTVFLSTLSKEKFTKQDLVDALAKYKGTTLEKKTVSNQTPEGFCTLASLASQVENFLISGLDRLCLNLKKDLTPQGKEIQYWIPNLADTLIRLLLNYESILFDSQTPFSPPPIPRSINNKINFPKLWRHHLAVLYVANIASTINTTNKEFTTHDLVKAMYHYAGEKYDKKLSAEKENAKKTTFSNQLLKMFGLEISPVQKVRLIGSGERKPAPIYTIPGLEETYRKISDQCRYLVETLRINLTTTLWLRGNKRKADSIDNTDDTILELWKLEKQKSPPQKLPTGYSKFRILNDYDTDPSLEEMPVCISRVSIIPNPKRPG